MFEICLRSASSYLCGAVAVAGILTCESRADSSKDYICSVTFARARVGVLFRCVSFIILNDIFDISMRSKMLSALKCFFRCLKSYTQVRRLAVEYVHSDRFSLILGSQRLEIAVSKVKYVSIRCKNMSLLAEL